jgi:hypothetical protein
MKDFQDYLKSMVEEPPVEALEAPNEEELSNQGAGMTSDLTNTEFDFMDHLKNALSKNTRKRIWGDW